MESENQQIILDSSVLVAFFDSSDSCHTLAKEIKEFSEIKIMPDFILQETATVLKNKKDLLAAIHFINLFSDNDNVTVISLFEHQRVFSKEFMNPENKDLSYVDASLLALHKMKKYKVITFDKNLKKLLDKVKK